MAYPFASEEWVRALVEEINGSSEYRNAAAEWGVGFNGNLLFVFEAGEGLSQDQRLLIRLEGGACQGASLVDADPHAEAGFALRAPYALWRTILEGKTLAATAILTGRMKVEGPKMTLLKHTAAHRALIHCTASVETVFP